ncbi:MAG: DUF4399 domain-containing protein [Acidobacteria bacterium]|nr:DUF4399 domain-containing protein [Acidobacteriota bacterium]
MTVRSLLALLATVLAASACGSIPPQDTSKPRVFFVEPQNGATVKSPVRLRFGIENYQLAAVPQGTVETSRAGLGHHHVGLDQDCLPPGTTIVKGTPSWIHFGDGKAEMEMQLPPGQHKLTLQLGDDLHKTIEGLCQTITINVAQ